ncbi:MAG: DNA recombination protein RmuC [Nocardioidaceae bacterium]
MKDPTALVLVVALALLIGLVLGLLLTQGRGRSGAHASAASANATALAVAPVKESLDRFDSRLRQLEASRVEWHTQLREQVEAVRLSGEALRRETSSLSTALRKPQVRGRWGEMHLQRAVELSGLVDRCDFTTQATVHDGDATLRPDMVVHLAGGKSVVVDSKVPLDAFLDATQSDDPAAVEAHLVRHARQLRAHVDALSAKSYWRQFDDSPEFVVLFMPGEAFLSAALDAEPALLDHAAAKRVVLATPTTLIALLRTVAYAWSQRAVAESAREIHTLARELYDRLGTLGAHVDKVGRSLTSAVGSYNKAVASLESRVLVSARRLQDLDIGADDLACPAPVEASVRPLSAPELLDDEMLGATRPDLLDDERERKDGAAGSARRAG